MLCLYTWKIDYIIIEKRFVNIENVLIQLFSHIQGYSTKNQVLVNL